MSSRNRYLCGTPEQECTGSLMVTNEKWRGTHKGHSTRDAAFDCYVKHLLKEGYERLSVREFKAPGNGPIIILTKRSRFGGTMRTGKERRFMPKRGSGEVWQWVQVIRQSHTLNSNHVRSAAARQSYSIAAVTSIVFNAQRQAVLGQPLAMKVGKRRLKAGIGVRLTLTN